MLKTGAVSQEKTSLANNKIRVKKILGGRVAPKNLVLSNVSLVICRNMKLGYFGRTDKVSSTVNRLYGIHSMPVPTLDQYWLSVMVSNEAPTRPSIITFRILIKIFRGFCKNVMPVL